MGQINNIKILMYSNQLWGLLLFITATSANIHFTYHRLQSFSAQCNLKHNEHSLLKNSHEASDVLRPNS